MSNSLPESHKFVMGYSPGGGGSGEDYISLKLLNRLTIVILANNATTVTGSTITFKQATNVAAGSEKSLAFPATWYSNIDTGASDTLVANTASSLTTDGTDNKDLMYVFSWVPTDLDRANGFDTVRVDLTAATASVLSVLYIGELRYGDKPSGTLTTITD